MRVKRKKYNIIRYDVRNDKREGFIRGSCPLAMKNLYDLGYCSSVKYGYNLKYD